MADTTLTHSATQAIRSLAAAGVAEREIHQLVTDVYVQESPPLQEAVDVEDLPIYDELPEGLIDLPTAAERYKRPRDTFRTWIRRGHIRAVGRLRAASPGGGYLVVRESELVAYFKAPRNPGGRPRIT